MANVRDSDTSLWLHNKLGTSNDSWTGGSICSQLNAEVLRNIKDCFPVLATQVKLKLLLSFFHIPRRNVEEWRTELEEIIEVAGVDSELWVSMLAEAMKTFPASGSLNTEISDVDETRPIFSELVNDLRKLVRRQSEPGMLPMECHYLNKAALESVVGQQPPQPNHFSIKKKPKSAYLRAELLQKSSDTASNIKKASAPVIPIRSRGMPRKMTDTTPLKGIPSRVPTSGFRSAITSPGTNRPPLPRTPAGRKDGGIKLLDITEQPLGYAAAKKRKRMQELEETRKAMELQQATMTSPGSAGSTATPATPDYAAGLTATSTYAPSTPQPASAKQDIPPTPLSSASGTTASTLAPSSNLVDVVVASSMPATPGTPSYAPPATPKPLATSVATTTIMAPITPQLSETASPGTPAAAPVVTNVVPVATTAVPAQQQQQIRPTAHVTQIRIQPPPAANPLQRKGLSLTREQMLEAQDMFRTANKVTRPEKALILGFMAGSRDNPCPHLGNIVTIKLSENQENVLQGDNTYQTMMVEIHFQMNYNTGEWKRIKKLRKIEQVVEQMPPQTATV